MTQQSALGGDMHPADEFLMHYGVPGMKWGKRKSGGSSDIPRKTQREAGKDAKEAAQAKMYYGEGAGIRRRQINEAVKSKMKDPTYAKAYKEALDNQSMAKAGSAARAQRKRQNVKNSTTKTAKGVRHIMNGNNQWANTSAVAIVAGAAYAKSKGYDKVALKKGATLVSEAAKSPAASAIKDALKSWSK